MKKHTLDLRDMPMFHEEMPMGAGAPELVRPVIDGIVAGETEVEMPAWLKRRLKKGAVITGALALVLMILANINISRTIAAPRAVTRSTNQSTVATAPRHEVVSRSTQPNSSPEAPKVTTKSEDLPASGLGGGQAIVTPRPSVSLTTPSPSITPSPSTTPTPSPSSTPSAEPSDT